MKLNRLAWIVLSSTAFLQAAEPVATPTSAPAMDEYTAVITFPVPGSTAGATSKAMVVVPREYLREDDASATAAFAASPTAGRRRYPVAYLLHGYAASHLRYHEKLTEAGKSLTDLADRFHTILVMPDGGCCSWYLDAATDQPDGLDWQYETIVTKHLIGEIDQRYRTWAERGGRGITGISMGGHGALYLAARHPDLFAAASSMSGVMDLRETLNPAPMADRIGSFEQHRPRWTEYSVLSQAERFAGQDTALMLDIGWDDPFLWSNRTLHDKLMRLNVPHDYVERPGKHEWKYWINALPYHLQFLTDRLKPAGSP